MKILPARNNNAYFFLHFPVIISTDTLATFFATKQFFSWINESIFENVVKCVVFEFKEKLRRKFWVFFQQSDFNLVQVQHYNEVQSAVNSLFPNQCNFWTYHAKVLLNFKCRLIIKSTVSWVHSVHQWCKQTNELLVLLSKFCFHFLFDA